jgi:hypothetical protein
MVENIIMALIVPLGLACLVKPFFLPYLLTTLMVLGFAPTVSYETTPIMKIGSINLFAIDYLILILFLLLMIFMAKNLIFKRHLLGKLMASRISKLVVALFLWSLFIGFLSYGKGFELQNVMRKISGEALMFMAILIPTIPDADLKKERFFRYSIFLGLLLVGFSLWKYFVSHDVEITSSGTIRTLLGNTVVIFMLPICYILFYSRHYQQHKLAAYTVIALLTIGIALTGHRSGMITLAFVILMYLMANNFKIQNYLWITSAGLTVLILVVLIGTMFRIQPGQSLLGDMVLRTSDTFNLENETTVERLSKWDDSLEISKKYPLLGLGRFPVHTDSIADDANLGLKYSFADLNKATHNMFAEQLANTGLLGLSIMLIFIYGVFRQFKNISTLDPRYADFLKVYFLSFLVFSQFNTAFSDPLGKIFLFIMLGFLNVQKLKESGALPAFSS